MAVVLLVVPQFEFEDEELAGTREELERAGHTSVVASHSPGLCTGIDGATVRADVSIDEVNLATFDAVVFIGGPGAVRFFTDPSALRIAQQARDLNLVVAAISSAPVVLANAGLLFQRLATSAPLQAAALGKKGALYRDAGVIAASDIVTARSAREAHAFGKALARVLGKNNAPTSSAAQ